MRGSGAQEKTVSDAPMGHAPPLPDDLRAALAEGRVTAHYQPIVDIRRGRLMQLEALARWIDPDRGSIPPSDFIPLAERSGLIGTITTLMIERALGDLALWRARVPGLLVAVNLSADSFAEPQLPDVIGGALAAAGCEAGCLGLEITESVLMKRPERSQGHVERLRALGVRVAIDDFGTGYSSLRYLQLLPVDEIKIDRQFIETSVDDRNSQVIVRSVIALCHELGFGVVAEGVADRDVWDLLAALSCDSAQGYFVAKPMPPEAVGRWIEDWQRTRPAAHPATPANGGRRDKPLVLIVDDEPTIVSLIEGVLGERGYRVITALNGQEALEAVARDRPSLVLLEIHVPIIGGEGFVTELVARRIDVPVVAMTAGPIAARWARKMGVQGSLAKPFSVMELLAAVERLATVN
jgi:EAL domain-containing protein (putative c-di-GMP-specific phosphodiesterase class I)